MLRNTGIILVLVCLLLQWFPDALHMLVHHADEHTQHALLKNGEASFDVAHKHCKTPEKAINAGYFPEKIESVFLQIRYTTPAPFALARPHVRKCNLKAGRAPPHVSHSA
jgi:hypothetical protein